MKMINSLYMKKIAENSFLSTCKLVSRTETVNNYGESTFTDTSSSDIDCGFSYVNSSKSYGSSYPVLDYDAELFLSLDTIFTPYNLFLVDGKYFSIYGIEKGITCYKVKLKKSEVI